MSSGQKAWAEDREAEAFTAHCKRLEAIGYEKIVEIADEIRQTLQFLEGDIVALPRVGWRQMDKLKELAKRIS